MNEKALVEEATPEIPKEPKLSLVSRIPTRLTEGRDELNFAEFPLSAVSERPNPALKTITFEDTIFDKSKNQNISRKVTITGSDAYGLPTPTDEEVLLALIQLSKLQNFQSKRVYFTRYQLLQLLKWKPNGQSYDRLDQALKRWIGVTLYYKNAWRNKQEKRWVDESFHMLENVKIVEAGDKDRSEQSTFDFASSYFEWNEVVFRSFQNGNVKALNYEFFLSIESSVAKRLFRFLDKRFFYSDEVDFDLNTLAFEHIGFSRNTPTADLKRKLNSAINELEEKGYLSPTPKERRFVKQAPKVWRVIFRRQVVTKLDANSETANLSKGTLEERLVAFGIREAKAAELIGQFPAKLIEEKLAVCLWLKEKKDSRISNNPAGFLIASIQEKYEAPKQYRDDILLKDKQVKAAKARKESEAKLLEKKQKAEAREALKVQAIRTYLDGLTEEAKARLHIDAMEQAEPSLKKMLNMGGQVEETTRKLIVDNYVLELIANG